jgi:hypothetical protein
VPRRKKEERKDDVVLMENACQVEPVVREILKDAEEWGTECGLKGSLRMDGPHVEKHPRCGHGYVLNIRELDGKQRMATAKYTQDGKRSFWQMDGMITG